MSKSIIKKIIVGIIIVLSTCTITACGGTSEVAVTFVNVDLPDKITMRFEANRDILETLHETGFISDASFQVYNTNISDMLSLYSDNKIEISETGLNDGDMGIFKAITQLRTYSWDGLGKSRATDKISYTDSNGNEENATIVYTEEEDDDDDAEEHIWGRQATNYFLMSNALVYGWRQHPDHLGYTGTVANNMVSKRHEINNMYIDITRNMSQLRYSDKQLGVTQKPDGYAYTHVTSGCVDWVAADDDENLIPYNIIDDDLANEICERMNFRIYVLKDNLGTVDGQSTLDGAVEAVQKVCALDYNNPGNATEIRQILGDYFEPLTDANNNYVTVLDLVPGNEEYIRYALIQDSHPVDLDNYDPAQKCGYDLVISQRDIDVPLMSIRFHEFNEDAYIELTQLLGISGDKKYLFIPGGGVNNICYLLEYPVYALNKIQEDSSDDTKVNGYFMKSSLGVNLYSGNIIKYGKGGTLTSPGFSSSAELGEWSIVSEESGVSVDHLIDEYYTIKGAGNNSEIGRSSFMIHGNTIDKLTIYISKDSGGYTKRTDDVVLPRIILRDYLEATYAPGFNDDNLVVFGRKIRLKFNDWQNETLSTPAGDKEVPNIAVFDKSTPVGYFIDKDGVEVANSQRLYITDFCDWRHLESISVPRPQGPDYLYDEKIVCIRGVAESAQTVEGTPDSEITGNKTIEDLDIQKVDSAKAVNPSGPWPNRYMAHEDWDTNGVDTQRFWFIATKKGLFNSGLYSGWINSTSSTASMDWWNSYLEANQFKYRLDHQDVNDFLLGNYKYQLGQSGVVILDLDTIAFIQEEMTEESEQERAELIRTIFIILGWIFICYSILLVPAWILDTNSDIGMDFLTKMTFGNWVAIKYREDIPNNDQSDTKYIGTTELVISVMILMLIGILLININIFDLVILLIKTIGKIAQHIEKMIKGMGV